MKLKLSERAGKELVALYQINDSSSSITHFLNTLISKEYSMHINSIPVLEDYKDDSTQQGLPTLQQ